MRWYFFGLGNPGAEYLMTRHNFGFMVLDAFAAKHRLKFKEDARVFSAYANFKDKAVLVKPLTFMNNSGKAVLAWKKRENIPLDRIFLIYDDMDLPLGKIKILPKGGSGGHKGVQSVIDALGSKDFPRMKLGIGKPANKDVINYVLSPFSNSELGVVKEVIGTAVLALEDVIFSGLQKAMNAVNSLTISAPSP
ncbi:MAG: aminoacyl-tRNA hydrolase [Thermodesulfobacteria bacterium]|nr:aminoacyl-tRNA hydrolase [Thermodesulfobacteriota bacterium]